MIGGAWSFLVRGLLCLVNSDNERDLDLLTRLPLYVSSGFRPRVGVHSFQGWFRPSMKPALGARSCSSTIVLYICFLEVQCRVNFLNTGKIKAITGL